MRKPESRAVTSILLEFSKLNESEQNAFISLMNKFLLASYKRRKLFVDQWESEHTSLESISDEIENADASPPT
ncbi:hypothetical protein [Metapseudomonas otitidis]|uniref:hypothetical protein n=1 Tax=Metapseudomonas otitidis TaxID=319939 RepID=UPI0013F652A7|nr:hypothetical protein [Pseudomonas otitidis]